VAVDGAESSAESREQSSRAASTTVNHNDSNMMDPTHTEEHHNLQTISLNHTPQPHHEQQQQQQHIVQPPTANSTIPIAAPVNNNISSNYSNANNSNSDSTSNGSTTNSSSWSSWSFGMISSLKTNFSAAMNETVNDIKEAFKDQPNDETIINNGHDSNDNNATAGETSVNLAPTPAAAAVPAAASTAPSSRSRHNSDSIYPDEEINLLHSVKKLGITALDKTASLVTSAMLAVQSEFDGATESFNIALDDNYHAVQHAASEFNVKNTAQHVVNDAKIAVEIAREKAKGFTQEIKQTLAATVNKSPQIYSTAPVISLNNANFSHSKATEHEITESPAKSSISTPSPGQNSRSSAAPVQFSHSFSELFALKNGPQLLGTLRDLSDDCFLSVTEFTISLTMQQRDELDEINKVIEFHLNNSLDISNNRENSNNGENNGAEEAQSAIDLPELVAVEKNMHLALQKIRTNQDQFLSKCLSALQAAQNSADTSPSAENFLFSVGAEQVTGFYRNFLYSLNALCIVFLQQLVKLAQYYSNLGTQSGPSSKTSEEINYFSYSQAISKQLALLFGTFFGPEMRTFQENSLNSMKNLISQCGGENLAVEQRLREQFELLFGKFTLDWRGLEASVATSRAPFVQIISKIATKKFEEKGEEKS
jgi:hypothetical protein